MKKSKEGRPSIKPFLVYKGKRSKSRSVSGIRIQMDGVIIGGVRSGSSKSFKANMKRIVESCNKADLYYQEWETPTMNLWYIWTGKNGLSVEGLELLDYVLFLMCDNGFDFLSV